MYTSSLNFQRTPAEKTDPMLFWQRDDKAFFAAGACHILAYAFMARHPDAGFKLVFIKPMANAPGSHLYAADGEWAFDYEGWTLERLLLRETQTAYSQLYPGWAYERVIIEDDLETFCERYNHRLPSQFAFSPWERAENYLAQFDAPLHTSGLR
jgi:hypothetical protein